MKFSIITVCKNSEKSIENAILSVINQTYKNFEYIIIDGVSTDNTLNIVNKYSDKISTIISEPDNGLYDAMNSGIKHATGDYLFFLNSDDQFLHENILKLVAENAEDSQAEVIYGDIAVLNKQTGTICIQKHNKFNKIYLMKNTPCQPGCFYKKSAFSKYGNFDTNYKIVSDHEWFLRVFLEHKIESKYLGFPINIFNIGGLSTNINQQEKLTLERNNMLDKYFTKFQRLSYEFISKKCRSLSVMPVISNLLDIFFRFKIR
ncbi:MAG: glycosyltransferase family 2 protein [bacterium]